MLQAVHQGCRRADGIAGQENGGAGNPLRRPLFQHRHQIGQRKLQLARFLEQKPAAAPPSVHQQHHHRAQRQRYPAALEHFQEVRGKEGEVEEQERRISAAAANGDHFQTFQITTKPIIPVTTMVPVTEMP